MFLQEEFAQLKLSAFPIVILNSILPIFAGLIIGVPIVAREIERGTAALPWTMTASRRSWLIRRVLVLGGAVCAMAALPWLTSEALASASNPGVDLAYSFREASTRGPVILARALVGFGAATLAGALLGRSLPALLLAVAATATVLLGIQIANEAWLRAEAQPLAQDVSTDESLVREIGYLLPDGRIVDWDSAWAALEDPSSNPAEAFPERSIGIAASLAPEKRTREVAIMLAAAAVATLIASVVVNRRRPY